MKATDRLTDSDLDRHSLSRIRKVTVHCCTNVHNILLIGQGPLHEMQRVRSSSSSTPGMAVDGAK